MSKSLLALNWISPQGKIELNKGARYNETGGKYLNRASSCFQHRLRDLSFPTAQQGTAYSSQANASLVYKRADPKVSNLAGWLARQCLTKFCWWFLPRLISIFNIKFFNDLVDYAGCKTDSSNQPSPVVPDSKVAIQYRITLHTLSNTYKYGQTLCRSSRTCGYQQPKHTK